LKSEPPARSGGVTIDLNDAAVVVGCSNDTWIHWKKAEIDVPKVSTASHDPGLFRICVSASTVRGKGSTPIPLRTMFEPSTVWQKEKKEKNQTNTKKKQSWINADPLLPATIGEMENLTEKLQKVMSSNRCTWMKSILGAKDKVRTLA